MKKIAVLLVCVIILIGFSLVYRGKSVEQCGFRLFSVQMNPFGLNDLAAVVKFSTTQPARVTVIVRGKDGAPDLVLEEDSEYKNEHQASVLGLYPNYANQVDIVVHSQAGAMYKKTLTIRTNKTLRRGLFWVKTKKQPGQRYYFLTDGIVLDEEGIIRLNFDNKGKIVYSFGKELVTEDRSAGLERFDFVGKLLQKYPWPKDFTSFSHGLGQKPNKNFLAVGSFKGTSILLNGKDEPTHRDFVIEIDYKTGELVNKWDLSELLNPNRDVIIKAGYREYGLNDWCHLNGIDYDETDKSIVVSCREYGMIKVDDETGELVWMITPHAGLERSGRNGQGPSIENKALIAVDASNHPYPRRVQWGYAATDNFKWPTKNHNARVFGNNLFGIYDNSGPVNDKKLYTTEKSIASIYKVDPIAHTVQHLWREDLPEYSPFGSNVIYRPETNDVLVFSANSIEQNQTNLSYSVLRRFDFQTHDVLFEAVLAHYYYKAEEFFW